jgi:glycosyltransferase involved in cell wall biosynthesis
MAKVCLLMMVKNEAKVLRRCLEAALPFVDGLFICDTGSSDGTIELAQELAKKAHKPFGFSEATFENYAQGRNEAFRTGRLWAKDFDYFLLCDPDMQVVCRERPFADVTEHAYYIETRSGDLRYSNICLVKIDRGYKFVGFSHELLQVPHPVPKLMTIHFKDWADGANRPDKLVRDIRLMTEDLKLDPSNARNWFYLGQTYQEAGEYLKAIDAYHKRLALGGFEEECYMSLYRIAHCCLRLNQWEAFVGFCWQAFERRPIRLEPLYSIAHYARQRNHFQIALAALDAALGINEIHNDTMFIEMSAYSYGIPEELSLCGYRSSKPQMRQAGARACRHLLDTNTYPSEVRERAKETALHYGLKI